MAKAKPGPDKRSQRQKFIDRARELEADNSREAFDRTMKAIASAPMPKAKKAAQRPKV